VYNIYVLVRPDAELFIKSVAKFFEVVIFTASISKYASPLLDILDKEKNIKHRLYRDHCTYINGIYIKDLKKCNRSLKDLIIVDNSPIAYTFDSDNGLPILTWIDDPDDRELMKLLPILEFLSKVKDVRIFTKIFVDNNKILYKEAMEIIKKEDLIDKKYFNVKNDGNKDNNTCNEYIPNIKVLPKENLEDSSLKEVKIIKKEEANVNINVNVNINNVKNNNDNTIIDINNRNDEIKLNLINKDNNTSNNTQNTFMEEGFNTTKNNKLNNNIYFNNKINSKEVSTNSNYTNNDINFDNKTNNKKNSQRHSKKNIFRFKQTNKIGINNIIFSNKYDPSIPLTLISSNIAKELLTPKASSQNKNNNNKGSFKKKKKKEKKNNIK
jgi:RNA polymerase II subunit A small phosphatase-like protein